MNISPYLTKEHRDCDIEFAKAEELASKGDMEGAKEAFEKFAHDTLLHFKKEEDELFKEFEAVTGSSDGPTMVMRYEHEQVRGLIDRMKSALDEKDNNKFLSMCESLMILLQQHNMKEEQMLYAMCDNLFPPQKRDEVISKMEEVKLD
ncbi:MAG: hemerythrin domain-containing protein [Epsilonproteobacteria bacterium]|nr:hemerythrin domain-containing protein [Campylobacterota bacterium]